MVNQQHYKAKAHVPFSAELIRLALLLRYISAQAHRLFPENFPIPSLSLLQKLRKGNLDAMKVSTYLRKNGKLSNDSTVMVDEMYLRKCVQYSVSKFIGCDKTGEFYKGIIVFMIQGLEHSVPVVVKGCPITALNGEWLAKEIETCLAALASCGFKVRGVVADNHAANANAFKTLHKMYPGKKRFVHSSSKKRNSNLSLFFDNVHLLKNFRNNMLNSKKFVFPAFSFNINEEMVQTDAGYIAESDLKYIYEQDSKLSAN